jgi:endonuclease/exonuclease/phosphatase family metal-dependent hydrolase
VSFAEAPYGELVQSTMRIMTWNVWGRFGPWQERAAALSRVLRDTEPDVVLLQECWIDESGGDQTAVLAAELGLHHCSGGGELLFGTWGLGNGLLSRWPITDAHCESLPALDPSGWGGIALRAVIDGPRGPILAYSVGLDWPPHASPARQHALGHLADLIMVEQQTTKAPLVVAGDFNAGPDSDEIRMLVGLREPARPGFVLFDAWDAAPEDAGTGATWSRANPWAGPTLLPDRRIDYIFTGWPRRGGVGSVVTAGRAGTLPVGGILASDHYAVYADIRY